MADRKNRSGLAADRLCDLKAAVEDDIERGRHYGGVCAWMRVARSRELVLHRGDNSGWS
jgi:hypothetical protein